MATSTDVLAAYKQLPDHEKAEAAAAISASRPLPDPPPDVVGPLWLIVVISFAVVFVGGTLGLFFLIVEGDKTEVVVPLVTAALGVLAGLLAPNPSSTKKS